MSPGTRWTPAALWLLVLAGCGEPAVDRNIEHCDAAYGLEPDCRFRAPADLLAVPGTDLLLVSEPGTEEAPGQLLLYDPVRAIAGAALPEETLGVVYPERAHLEPAPIVGEVDCAPPAGERFAPGGMDAVEREDGRIEVLVVNEGGRHAVEIFELIARDAGDGVMPGQRYALRWRNCVRSPDAASFGDIAAAPDGRFWVTQAFPRDRPFWSYLKARLGFSTGYLYRWHPQDGFSRVAGTETRLPSGIALAADASHVYYGTYVGGEVISFDLERGEAVGRVNVMRPRKMSWGRDGSLLVASHTAGFLERGECGDGPPGACGASFEILAIEPGSMASSVILAHQGAPIGAVDAVVNLGDSLYLASPRGDRIVRFTLDPRGVARRPERATDHGTGSR